MPRSPRPGPAAFIALALLASAAGCNPEVIGNGKWAEKQLTPDSFDRVSVSLGFRAGIRVVSGPGASRSVTLSGDENVLEHISLEVVNGTLVASSDFPVTSVHPLQLSIETLELSGLEAQEGASVTATGVTAGAFAVRAVEGSRVALSGAPGPGATLTATVEAGSVLDARAFPVASAEVALSSHAHADLLCTGPVTGSASEGSEITIAGGGTCSVTLTPAPPAQGAATCVAASP